MQSRGHHSVRCSVSDDLFAEEARLRSELKKESDFDRKTQLANRVNELVRRRHGHVEICSSCQKEIARAQVR